ncbi:MAG: hypothetical protein LBI67_00660 [Treponema sp.]|jgi:hypothetical protein|nr:hypothetical protein [Treponema sp.]
MKPVNHILLGVILCAAAFPAAALDFGLIVSEQFDAEDSGELTIESKTILSPWLSFFGKKNTEYFMSAGLTGDYSEEKLHFIPELFRLEASIAPSRAVTIKAGRIPYQDPSRFTAKGHFDGVNALVNLGRARFSLAAFYTGLLYRDTANVSWTPGDPVDQDAEFDFANFGDTYFAPRRVLAAVQGEFPGFLTPRGNLSAGILGQFDFSDAPDKLNSQYALFRYSLALTGGFDLALAGAAELLESAGELDLAFAGSLEGGWMLPTAVTDRISLACRWASGTGSAAAAFFPVTVESQGRILRPDLSGMMTVRGVYEARFLPSLAAEFGARYFFRTDSSSFSDPDLTGSSYFLGGEITGSVLWAPFSDLSFALSGGAFLPQTGSAFRDGAPVRWLVSLGTIFSL